MLCLCDEMVAASLDESCCAVQQRSCCCEAPSADQDGETPVEAHAPCASCRDLSTPDAPATRAPSNQHDTLDPALLLPLPKSFAIALFEAAPRRAALRPTTSHAPPRAAAAVPLRI
ncbi:MAG: hypothetical protein L6Q99_16200 [Planctomycetes bacterium]|nr:hypothetical protein [Planctomycetota bacterium]